METSSQDLLRFLEPQLRDFGGKVEIDAGLWSLFVIDAADTAANALARSLLGTATFAHESGASADDRWTIYYVDTANRPAALHWLEDLHQAAAGEIRPVSPEHRALIREMIESAKPHRVAQGLADLHARGELRVGAIHETPVVRSLLDRLHQSEPLFFSAFITLLTHQLIDMLVLHRQLLPEDVALINEIVKGGLSRDPFLQTRQDAAAGIRNTLLRFQLINPIDQQKNTAIANPYAVYLEVVVAGEQVTAPIDGNAVTVPRRNFLAALHAIRSNLYRGADFNSFDTQAPWMTEALAYPFRFIKQRVDSHRALPVMDSLYMLERAVET